MAASRGLLKAYHSWKIQGLVRLAQAGSDSSPVSERPRTTVSVGALHPGLQCWHAAASFCVPPTVTYTWGTAFPAQHLRPSDVLSCWPDGLELTPGFYSGSNEQHRLFRRLLKTRVTSASSALGVLNEYAPYKSTHSLTLAARTFDCNTLPVRSNQ